MKVNKTVGATTVMTSLALGVPSSLILVFIHGPLKGLILGALIGALFGLCMAIVIDRQFKTLSKQWERVNGQTTLKCTMAIHRLPNGAKHGLALMTSEWFAFRAQDGDKRRVDQYSLHRDHRY